jgi:hypothetical protein
MAIYKCKGCGSTINPLELVEGFLWLPGSRYCPYCKIPFDASLNDAYDTEWKRREEHENDILSGSIAVHKVHNPHRHLAIGILFPVSFFACGFLFHLLGVEIQRQGEKGLPGAFIFVSLVIFGILMLGFDRAWRYVRKADIEKAEILDRQYQERLRSERAQRARKSGESPRLR